MGPDTAVQSDLDTLPDLNRAYTRSVQTSDVRRFDEILAGDFLCSNPDGSFADRGALLGHTALPVKISNLEAHDVRIRLLGDPAIIDARHLLRGAPRSAGFARRGRRSPVTETRWLRSSGQV